MLSAKRIDNAGARDLEQPGFERTQLWFKTKLRHVPRERHERFLNNILRGCFGKPGLPRHVENQSPVSFEEFTPARLIVEISQAAQQRLPRRNQIFSFSRHKASY